MCIELFKQYIEYFVYVSSMLLFIDYFTLCIFLLFIIGKIMKHFTLMLITNKKI